MKQPKENTQSRDSLDLASLVDGICQRPFMYTAYSDLTHAAVFIEGFAHSRDDAHDEIRQFNLWLSERLNFPRNEPWWDGLLQVYPKSEDAFRELRRLFKEFKESTEKR